MTWTLTPAAFERLLASLDEDRDRAGEKYERIRAGLASFFRWRGALSPDEHADETINRIARKIERGDVISDPFAYAHGVARMVLLETYKEREKERVALANLPQSQPPPDAADSDEAERLDCLRTCLGTLPAESRTFIAQYYQGEKRVKIENRQRLAAELRVPLNALRLRAQRIREKLETCTGECVRTRGAR